MAFGINSRSGPPGLPTTFFYDSLSFVPFSGSIEHTGSVFFNSNTVEVDNFSINYDASRVGTLSGEASGFYVKSTTGINAILFDVENPSLVQAGPADLTIEADLLVSPEFGGFLFNTTYLA